jgi:DNA ligase 1
VEWVGELGVWGDIYIGCNSYILFLHLLSICKSMNFSEFTRKLSEMEGVTSRISLRDAVSSIIEKVSLSETKEAVYLLTGSLGPVYSAPVFNLGDKLVLKSAAKSSGKDEASIFEHYQKSGDLGLTYLENASSSNQSSLSIKAVHTELVRIAILSGEDSQQQKVDDLSNLLSEVDRVSGQYIIKMVLGRLRLGFSEKTVLDALALSSGNITEKKKLQRAYELYPDIGKLVEKVRKEGFQSAIRSPRPMVGTPILPMLAQRLGDTKEMIKKMGEVSVEPKFDGLRAQIHFDRKSSLVRVYTRNLKEISAMFPEVLDIFKHTTADSGILDAEAIGVNEDEFTDFQTTMKRRRKHGIGEMKKDIPLSFQVFDVMLLDGDSLVDKPYSERRKILSKLFSRGDLFTVDEYAFTADPSKILSIHKTYRDNSLEGVIVKKSDSLYMSGRLGWNWVKMKENEGSVGKLSDTVDCVVMGFSFGKGKRAGLGLGKILVGVMDGVKIKSITKVGTGLTDEMLTSLRSRLDKITTKQMPDNYECSEILLPDVWVLPEIVLEIAADDITVSPNHTAGYALRFPRLVKIREDKSVKDATSLKEVEKLYKLQKN